MCEWQNVEEDGLPEELGEYVCHFADGSVEFYDFECKHMEDGEWFHLSSHYNSKIPILDWMPKPVAPPIKGKKDGSK